MLIIVIDTSCLYKNEILKEAKLVKGEIQLHPKVSIKLSFSRLFLSSSPSIHCLYFSKEILTLSLGTGQIKLKMQLCLVSNIIPCLPEACCEKLVRARERTHVVCSLLRVSFGCQHWRSLVQVRHS